MNDTLVFIPAWNEEDNLPAVLDALRAELPDADVLVVDDGSTDRTAERRARARRQGAFPRLEPGAAVRHRSRLPVGARARLRVLRPGRRRRAASGARARPPPRARARAIAAMSRSGRASSRAKATRPTVIGRALLAGLGRPSCDGRWRSSCDRPFGDATSGLYAVNAKALPLLAETFQSGAPEVEALIRIARAGLRLEEVPVTMDGAGERRVEAARLEGREARSHRDGDAPRRALPAQAATLAA